jgi:hypothetical protein
MRVYGKAYVRFIKVPMQARQQMEGSKVARKYKKKCQVKAALQRVLQGRSIHP